MRIAVFGIGIMGAGMAGCLLEAGHQVTVWNRRKERAAPLGERGARIADDPADAAAGAEVLLTLLYDEDAIDTVMGEALPAAGSGTWWIQSSTIGRAGAERTAALAAEHGVGYVDAPVLGTRAPAESGQLVVLASGPTALIEQSGPVFDAVGSRTLTVSARPGDASALKLAANAWVASINAATAQSVALARATGLDPQLFLDAIAGGAVDSAYAQLKGRAMIADAFPPSFALDGVRKDLGLIGTAAAESGVSTTVIDALAATYDRASERGHGDEDMAAVVHGFGRD